MDYSKLNILIIDKQIEDANNFLEALKPEFDFVEVEIARTPHKGIQSFIEKDFDLCFLADLFSEEEVESFIKDLSGVDQSRLCVPIHLRLNIAANERRDSYKQRGFPYIISRQASELDKQGLEETIRKLLKDKEIQRRVLDIDDAMKVALREIDKLAESIKRSSSAKLDIKKFPMQFMELQAEFDEKVLEEYYNTLQKQTENAKASNVTHLYIPEEVLAKRYFPCLSQDGYTGVSHRVWERLKKNYGITHENAQSSPKPNPELISEKLSKDSLLNQTKKKTKSEIPISLKGINTEDRLNIKMENMVLDSKKE